MTPCRAKWLFAGVLLLAQTTLADVAWWPMFRGSQDLAGVAQGTLREPLKLRWSFKTGGPVKSSAAIDNGKVFVGSDDGSVYALDLATGKRLWSFGTGESIESSPLALNGAVYVGSGDGKLYALDAASGALKWCHPCGDKILGAPNWARLDAKECILVGSYDNKMHCVEAATGQEVWAYDTGNFVNGAPAFAQGRVVFGGCDARIHALAVTDGKPLKEIEAGAYIAGSCAVKGRFAYAGHYENQVVCADLEAGKLLWRFKESKQPFFSTPAVTETRVLIGGRDRKLYCLDRETGRLVWAFATQGVVDSSPAVCGDRVVIGSSDGRLYLVDFAEGKLCWSYEIGKALTSSPAVAAGVVVIGSEDGSVYAFEMTTKP